MLDYLAALESTYPKAVKAAQNVIDPGNSYDHARAIEAREKNRHTRGIRHREN